MCGLAGLVSFPGASEKTLILGSSFGWKEAERRSQVAEVSALRPYPVLALSSAWTDGSKMPGGAEGGPPPAYEDIMALYTAYRNFPLNESALDLALSFDQTDPLKYHDTENHYRVESARVQSANGHWARYGAGAALFSGITARGEAAPLRVRPQSRNALFSAGQNVGDFSLELWIYPNNLENGEQIFAWAADTVNSGEDQRISCETLRNRLRWTFKNFFTPPGGNGRPLSVSLETKSVLVPKIWTHHIIRYNVGSGLLEYLVNGRIENMAYTTASGGEGGGVYVPLIGRNGAFTLGERFNGLIDEFRVYSRAISAPGRTALAQTRRTSLELPELAKFPKNGGRAETRAIDLGEPGSQVIRLEVSGGRWTASPAGHKTAKNSYAGKGSMRFPDNSGVQFFIRAGEEPYLFDHIPWTPVLPGAELFGRIQGRYVQIAAAFYPSGDCETTPYLEEIRLVYDSNDPPWPPSLVTARALDGAVELSWRPSPDEDAAGYLVYYGTSSGVYYGEGAVLGESPLDAGKRTSLRIEGLKNGTLYFFTVAAYDAPPLASGGINTYPSAKDRRSFEAPPPHSQKTSLHPGKFSKEVSVRPLRMIE